AGLTKLRCETACRRTRRVLKLAGATHLEGNQETRRKPMPSRIASKTYGTVSADRQKEMSGLEFVQGLVDGTLPLNTIAATLGYDVTEVVSGRVVVTATPNGTPLNPAGTVHGGLVAPLLDSCMGLAIRSTLEKGYGRDACLCRIGHKHASRTDP